MIDWSKIETVLLDMDGTLLDLHYDSYFWLTHLPKIYADENNIPMPEVMDVLNPIFKANEGTLNWYCVNFWSDKLQLDIMAHKHEVADKISYRPFAQDFLQRCNAHTEEVHLITNAHRQVLNLKIQHTDIDQYFKTMLCSHELGAPKEQATFWQKLHQDYGFNPSTTVFIDDSEPVLDAASNFGIEHIFSIAQPDSQTTRDKPSKHQMITNFTDF